MIWRGLCFFAALLLPVQGNVFSTPHKLADLFFKEEELARRLSLLAKKYNYNSVVLRHYLFGIERRNMELAPLVNQSGREILHQHMDQILEKLVGNPVHVLCLLDRLVLMTPQLLQEEFGLSAESVENFIRLLGGEKELPEKSDLDAAIVALSRIQFVYKLDPIDISQGLFLGTKSEARLSRRQMVMIANSRYSGEHPQRPHLLKEYALALEWAEASLNLEPDTTRLLPPANIAAGKIT